MPIILLPHDQYDRLRAMVENPPAPNARLRAAFERHEVNMPITQVHLDNWFAHHPPPDEEAVAAYNAIREGGKKLAELIIELTPPSADQTAAIRKLREVVMIANAAIACDGK